MPREDRIGRYDGRNRTENLPAQRLPFGSQSATLIVGKPQTFPFRLELLLQNPIFFDQVCDHVRLLTGNPAGERG